MAHEIVETVPCRHAEMHARARVQQVDNISGVVCAGLLLLLSIGDIYCTVATTTTSNRTTMKEYTTIHHSAERNIHTTHVTNVHLSFVIPSRWSKDNSRSLAHTSSLRTTFSCSLTGLTRPPLRHPSRESWQVKELTNIALYHAFFLHDSIHIVSNRYAVENLNKVIVPVLDHFNSGIEKCAPITITDINHDHLESSQSPQSDTPIPRALLLTGTSGQF
ncbi:hypothetical protein J6590_033354 [Homalodisca vitripennis]|nr:hypothetical protein J6590_033354 [Homalodisca vitripennis]